MPKKKRKAVKKTTSSPIGIRAGKGMSFSYVPGQSPELVYLAEKDKVLARIMDEVGPIDVKLCDEFFPFMVHIVVEQLLSVKAANTIYARVESLCEERTFAEFRDEDASPVTPDAILGLTAEELRECGLSNTKTAAIQELAKRFSAGQFDIAELDQMEDAEVEKLVTSVKGLGPWSAKMVMMFALGREDMMPIEDAAFVNSYRKQYGKPDMTAKEIEKACECWKPYRSLGTRYLYKAIREVEPSADVN